MIVVEPVLTGYQLRRYSLAVNNVTAVRRRYTFISHNLGFDDFGLDVVYLVDVQRQVNHLLETTSADRTEVFFRLHFSDRLASNQEHFTADRIKSLKTNYFDE